MEELQREHQRVERRQQREKKELEDRIQVMKSSVPKGDKKKKKQMLLDVARLEAEMEQRHQQELEKFEEVLPKSAWQRSFEAISKGLAKMNLENQPPPHLSKIQKRRERRAALERERQKAADAETRYLASYRREEEEKLAAILEPRNLEMRHVPPDSHCLYRAIQDQLASSVTLESLRRRTARYLRQHVEEFLPFFSDPETSDAHSRDDFLRYCDDIMPNASWGGQMELRALSHVLQSPIEVIQTELPVLVVGEEYGSKPLTLVYVRYASSFGDHYNSVKPLEAGAVGGATARFF
ncbi:OTU domain-containing protein 6A [Saccopteryx bilineata]|uniref:OTU domain-containing protein 6A n=1 Tax=Saccopteryx bilineata TaxID=59482 RepID=UPI00338D8A20